MTERLPKWVKDPRELGMIAQWSEDWREYHEHGLASVIESGRVTAALFTETLRDGDLLTAFPPRGDAQWRHWLNGRLMAGVGAEILLKGLYLKRGYSIRAPNRDQEPLAPLGSPEAQRLNPRRSVTFAVALEDHNVRLLSAPGSLKPLHVAQDWRNTPAHAVPAGTMTAGVWLIGLGLTLRFLHDALLEGANPSHAELIGAILRDCRSVFPGG